MTRKYLSFIFIFAIQFLQSQTTQPPGQMAGDTGSVILNYLGFETTYTTVRAKDGNIWLQQNLGSTAVAGTQNDENAYGDLFQWGRWDDGHQKRTSALNATPTVNNPVGLATPTNNYLTGWWTPNALSDRWDAAVPSTVSETNGCDPCRALGEGWKIPSETEWEAIVDLEAISNPATAFQSNLKLPASGYRSASGALTFVGTRGYFWSTTTSSSGAKYLYVGTTLANPSAGAPRAQGASIRCMKLQENLGVGQNSKSKFSVYPNPANEMITVQSEEIIKQIVIYNALGQLISTTTSPQTDIRNLVSGIYIVAATFENGQIATQKIIKN